MTTRRFWARSFRSSSSPSCSRRSVAALAGDKRSSFRPGELWPDDRGVHVNAHGGGILDFEGRYYWFGEHKVEGEAGNSAQVGIHGYSSRDLYRWKDEGVVLPVVKDDADHDLAVGSIVVERPKVIHNRKTGKFVMWFHLERKGYRLQERAERGGGRGPGDGTLRLPGQFPAQRAARGPVASAPSRRSAGWPPRGNEYSGGELPDEPDRLNIVARDFDGGQMARDQTLFVDDDGTAYHVYASEENSTLHISRLTRMTTWPRRGTTCGSSPAASNEAPALFKHEGRYYLDRLRLHGVGPERGPLGGGGLGLGPLDRAREPGGRPRGRADVRFAEHVRPAGARPPGGVRLHGGPVAPEERHRRALRLAACPLPQRPGRDRVARRVGPRRLRSGAPWRRPAKVVDEDDRRGHDTRDDSSQRLSHGPLTDLSTDL